MNTFEMLSTVDEMIAIAGGKIEGKAWIKGNSEDEMLINGRPVLGMCLGGMLRRVTMTGRWNGVVDMPPWITFENDPLVKMIGTVILEQYPQRVPSGLTPPDTAIVPFNDHPETMNTDIVRVLEKTRVAIAEAV
jgi:hypothetical protein